ncbi:hypothetical protein C8E97_4848 [Saccharothrix australiensis]|uniref:Uncharacterized protein n=1 Tax=Saccharothrix australiensis TaxID=2072 RepID=A0A495W3T7_9PSEU|nr:hypothetical protein C8E97_4848 [Saccharothrix australiensis]
MGTSEVVEAFEDGLARLTGRVERPTATASAP